MYTQCHKAILIGYTILLFALLLSAGVRPREAYAQSPEPAARSASPTVTGTPPAAAPTVAGMPTLTPAREAQATSIPVKQNVPGVTEVTFAQLVQETFELHSPTAEWSFSFDAPYRWAISGGDSFIELHYEAHDTASSAEPGTIDATVDVYFNDVLAASFSPIEGSNQALRIPIPPQAVGEPGQDQHEIRFTYLSSNCDDPYAQSLFSVYDHSFIHFQYELLPIEINLTEFPRPLVQNPFEPESILIIIPDQYSDADLAAAASVAAAVGQRTFGSTALDVITAVEATPARLANTSAIIIGQPNHNAFLLALYQRNRLPTTLTADGLFIVGPTNQPLPPDDGLLQEINSDFSDDHVYLVVTGASDVAVAHAAQTLSVLKPRYGFYSDLVIITEFYEIMSEAKKPTETFSLADLGFKDTTFYGINTQRRSVRFFIPSNWRFVDKPTLTLSYIHSSKLQFDVSGLTIRLNNELVGSVPIDETTLGERQAIIELPRDDLELGGYNRLDFEAILNIEFSGCVLPDKNLTWIRINDTSQLKLPHVEVEETHTPASLRDPFASFASRQDLSDVWFSLPQIPTRKELAGMVNLASSLGGLSGGPGFAPRLSRGVISDTEQLKRHHVIAFGRPTSNPVIAMMNEYLPQPFVPGEDNLRQEIGNVVYRLPDNFSLGVLQTLPAPWNPGKVVLVVTGTTPEGVERVINALTGDLYYGLSGDLAFIREEQVESFDSAKFIRIPLETVVETVTEAGEGEGVTLEEVVPSVKPPRGTSPAPTAPTPTVFIMTPPTSTDPFLTTPTPTTLTLIATSEPITPELETVITTTIPERYSPQNSTPLEEVTGLAFGLVGAGIAVAVVGIIINNRKKLTGSFLSHFFRRIYKVIPEKIRKLIKTD